MKRVSSALASLLVLAALLAPAARAEFNPSFGIDKISAGVLVSTPQYTPVQPPHARMKNVPRKLGVAKLTGFSGIANDPGGTVAKVQIALVKAASVKAGRAATCQELQNAKGRFKIVKAVGGNCPLLWLNATGTAKWSFRLTTVLPPGRYVVYSRALDGSGLAETGFSRAAGNRYGFRLLAPEPPSVRNP